jgi:two-component system alkaline phosphatase synthesis response regulator PhoP
MTGTARTLEQTAPMPKRTILIVEDEPDIRKLVHYNLTQERFSVLEAEDGEEALKVIRRDKPHLIILDLMLPGLSGLELCRIVREQAETAQMPILMLTAKAGEADRVVGLEMGADDYLVKPFSPRELVARVKAILRRAEQQSTFSGAEFFEKGPLKINFSTYEVCVKEKPVKLTLKEFELLRFLVRNSNRVLSRDQLLDRVWGGEVYVDPRTVDVHIRRLRKAIEKNDSKPTWILTVRGVGYKFDERALAE